MRARTTLFIVLAVAVLGLGGWAFVSGQQGVGPLAGWLDGTVQLTTAAVADDGASAVSDGVLFQEEDDDDSVLDGEDEAPPADEVRTVDVVVATTNIPAGTVLTAELLTTQARPDDNVAVRAGYVFNNIEDVVGRIVGTDIARGQEVLDAMLALNPTDLTGMGSDLALYVERGEVAIAFPIDLLTGVAFTIRPGDRLDVLVSAQFTEVDPEFQSALPNNVQIVDETALLNGGDFLFDPLAFGRLELVPLVNQVAFIRSSSDYIVERPITQLTVQQAEVLWVGNWADTDEAELITREEVRFETNPDVVILGVTLQDAMFLKWALEVGLDVDFVLRSQGDETVFITTAVSLPQIVEQTGVIVPDQGELRLSPSIYDEDIEIPALEDEPDSGDN